MVSGVRFTVERRCRCIHEVTITLNITAGIEYRHVCMRGCGCRYIYMYVGTHEIITALVYV